MVEGDVVEIVYGSKAGYQGIYLGIVPNTGLQSWTDCHVKLFHGGSKITIETDCIAFVRKNTPIDKWLYG